MDARTAEALLGVVEQLSPALMGLNSRASLERIEEQRAEFMEALQWCVEQSRTDDAMRMSAALATYWRVSRRLPEGCTWLERSLGMSGGDDTHRGRASYEAAMLEFWRGNDDRATALHQHALAIGRRLADPTLIALALCGLARIALRSNIEEARQLCREALAVTEGTSDRLGRSSAIHVLGVAAQMAGDLLEARRFMTERITMAREMGSHAGASLEASNLSMVELQLGDLDRADALAREALDIFHRREDHWALPYGLNSLAAVARKRGEFARAATLIGAAEGMIETQRAAWPPDERSHYEATLSTLTGAMDSAEFERARAAGRSMSPPAAVDFALGKVAAE